MEPPYSKSSFLYNSCFCEENVYHLVKQLPEKDDSVRLEDLYVVFISNINKSVPIWKQLKCPDDETPVVWDYHVILFDVKKSAVLDFDSSLPFPCSSQTYLNEALCSLYVLRLPTKFHRYYRVIPAYVYLESFASDRSHMQKDGIWLADPPNYAPIINLFGEQMTLPVFWDMTFREHEEKFGKVYNEQEFLAVLNS